MALIFWLSVVLIGYTYFLYPAILLLLRKGRRSISLPADSYIPSVTVVVSVYNEENFLREKLSNMRELEYPRDKITFLFGSDGSNDRTNAILSAGSMPNMILKAFPRRRGKAQVLNDLVASVESEIIVFSDANTIFAPDVILKLARHFADPVVGAVCGSLILQSDKRTAGGFGESSYWKYEDAMKRLESQIKTTVSATGGVYALRRDLFKPLPTSKAVPDDFLLPMNVLREGKRIVFEPEALAYEKVSNSVIGEFQRKVRIGTSAYYSISELGRLLHPRTGFISFALWSRKLIRWFVPFCLILMLLSSMVLSYQSGFFLWTLAFQVLFYLCGFVGFLLERIRLRIGVFGLPYYFAAMNLALLIGFVRFLMGWKPFTWEVVR